MSMTREWNQAEFAFLFNEHYERILRVARRMVGSSNPLAEEIGADSFWRLYRAGPPIDSTGSVYSWHNRTAIRTANDALRAKQRRSEEKISVGVDPEDRCEHPLAGCSDAKRSLRLERVGAAGCGKVQIILPV